MISAVLTLVLAFPSPLKFQIPATENGGNGGRYTGSPSQKWDCAVCHVGAKTTLAAEGLTSYEPGKSYDLVLSLPAPSDAASVSVELADSSGKLVGKIQNAASLPVEDQCTEGTDPLEVQAGGQAAISRSCKRGLKAWHFVWTAPDTDVGPVMLHAAAVAGNADGNHRGDQSAAIHQRIAKAGSEEPPPPSCAAVPGSLLLLALTTLRTIRPERSRRPMSRTERSRRPPEIVLALLLALLPTSARAEEEPPGLEARLGVGAGRRAFTSDSASYPARYDLVLPAYPELHAALTFRFLKLADVSVLRGLELRAEYSRGIVPGGITVGENVGALPFRATLALGYAITAGPVRISPALSYGVFGGGVEKNLVFEDPTLQDVGVELGLGIPFEALSVELRPRVSRIWDAGYAEHTYGSAEPGMSYGGELFVDKSLTESVSLVARYAYFQSFVTYEGGGSWPVSRVTTTDLTQSLSVSLRYSR